MSAPPAAPVAFALDAAGLLALPGGASDDALWHALTHRVMRRPDALGEHVRRLALCRRPAARGRAAGALADLLHVLDGRGDALAARMLGGLAHELTPVQGRLLARWVAGERPAPGTTRTWPGSVLPSLGGLLAAGAARASGAPARTAAPGP